MRYLLIAAFLFLASPVYPANNPNELLYQSALNYLATYIADLEVDVLRLIEVMKELSVEGALLHRRTMAIRSY
ncbi:hypothetical protein [Shewanella woodyi]|uniref:hypothetical protein n=1 Tax=Shewanella woodyi TaxID=60961 RepID=UPI00374A314D